ncbi:nucleotide-diphospho-sugar transferase [Rhexocercosporidium sp. MPI-PUGE-AT-0058]|nr:nucleotide-diphospho-sugar transferase [Rhexocercosporidium sp. MPI-PUGE-AT-0058]
MGSISNSNNRAWVTLLTRSSYIPGVVLLAHSLQSTSRNTHLSSSTLQLYQQNASQHFATKFEDTWTKLRIFELFEYERLVFLDADMLVFRNMDELFDMALPGRDWIAANHCCVCNLDKDEWAPEDWIRENCAYTGLAHPTCLANPAGVPKDGKGLGTHTLLNSGLFICTPYEQLWKEMLQFLETSPLVKHFMFPDQDFLAEFFRGRWMAVGYQYNALKTMRYWHAEMWRDEEVRNLHYIVDKPWSKRLRPDGTAGYLGKDGETHRWWWDEFERWETEREKLGETAVLDMVRKSSPALAISVDEGYGTGGFD